MSKAQLRITLGALTFTSLMLSGSLTLRGEDPAYYRRLPTWEESLLASLEAIRESGLEDGFEMFETGLVRGGDPALPLGVDISGASEMYLFVTRAPEPIWGVGTWAAPRLIDAAGAEKSLSDGKMFQVLEGQHAVDMNLRAGLYQELRIAGREFARGINVLADSVIRVPLDGRYERFEALVGIDDWSGNRGQVRFAVTGSRTAARRMLWRLLLRDFPEGEPRRHMRWEMEDRIWDRGWSPGEPGAMARRFAMASHRVPALRKRALRLAREAQNASDLARVRRIYYRSRRLDTAVKALEELSFRPLRMAIEDLVSTFGDDYPGGAGYLERLGALEQSVPETLASLEGRPLPAAKEAARTLSKIHALRDEALRANPLLDFEKLLVIRRVPKGEPRRSQWGDKGLGEYIGLPRQSSWGISTIPNPLDWDNEIAVLSPVNPEGRLDPLFKPEGRPLVTDFDLHYDGERLLFSMPDSGGRWQLWEMRTDGGEPRQLTPGDHPDVHCYDGCYLPDGGIIFVSTAPLQGVPCNASVIVGMLYRMEADGSGIQQLCFEQDHDYTPSVLNDGRVLYLRWDYTDTPHVWNRLLMSMNPDGTAQMEYYGSNSYWPNGVFFARAIPGHPTKVAGIVTGHHEGRVGELVIFDPSLGRHEVQGVVQRIPGHGRKVEPRIEDKLTEHSWPKFLHPWPLSEKYFIVSAKPTPDSLWGIYLVDVFDNMVLLREEEHHVLLEPVPFQSRPSPRVMASHREPGEDALVYLADVYQGRAMEGIPRGTVRSLRVFTYHFGYQRLAGIDHRVGADGPWEVKRVLGTVPVEEDGSAFFRAPSKTPISVQPLDRDGKAVALMRSWMTAMPGETLSCVGCHEHQSTSIPNRRTRAFERSPSEISPWYGPARGFSYRREVQPVLDRHCTGCHDGSHREDGRNLPDLRAHSDLHVVYSRGDPEKKVIRGVRREELLGRYGAVFDPSYVELRKYVRTGGLESDLHPLPPMEFHADTCELVQMLQKGHHGVKLDREDWDRLVTWVDLNAPCHGTWGEVTRIPGRQRERRVLLRELYGGVPEDYEEQPDLEGPTVKPVTRKPHGEPPAELATFPDWPFDAAEARRRQEAEGSTSKTATSKTVDLGRGISLELVRIPAGSFVLGDSRGDADEQPPHRRRISSPFWMSRHEITNEQYALFDPSHDSRFEHRTSWIFSERYLGWRLNHPRQPVVRVSCREATAFCEWLSGKIQEEATLPTEAQWEYACRAGTDTALSYGDVDADFSRHANLADSTLRELAYEGWRPRAPDLVPRDNRFSDGFLVTAEVGSLAPNAWGLQDMHGNVAEWTRSFFEPYPGATREKSAKSSTESRRVVRGGSWRDRPYRCRSSFRLGYLPHQKVFNVGFRVVIECSPEVVRGEE